MNKLVYQPGITINHNWSKTIQVLNYGIDLVQTHSPKITKEYKYSEYGYLYEIGSSGTVSHITNGSEFWYNFTGPLVESTMPWLKDLLSTVEELEPAFVSINKMVGNGAEHRDQPGINVGLNYFINTTNSTTYVKDDDGYTESYPSVAKTGWIADISKLHRIENTDERIWFNLRFGKPFLECKEWFASHPNLVFGAG